MIAPRRSLLAVLLLIGLMGLCQAIGPQALRYQPGLLEQGEYWRFLSGHWVHANWPHYALNMAGFGLCLALTEVAWGLWSWSWRVVVLGGGISSLFQVLNPDIGWYVGFSGVLFGLYVLAAVDSLPRQRLMASVLLAIVALKVILDLSGSVRLDSSELIGVPVLTDAHVYGVGVALIIVLLMRLKVFFRDEQTQDIHE